MHRQAEYRRGARRRAATASRLPEKPEGHTGAGDDGATAVGSLFVVNVKTRAEAKAFSDGDPFTQTGVFDSVAITRMNKGQWNPEAAEGA